MEKIKRIFQRMSLKKALSVIAVIVLVFVTVLSVFTILKTSQMRQNILNTRAIKIKTSETEYGFVLQPDKRGNNLYYEITPDNYTYGKLSARNQIYYNVATFLMIVLPIIYVILGTFAVVKFYYRVKLCTPIETLKDGINYISNYDLDFEMIYESDDELGMLCNTFEEMRKELYRNNQKVWDMFQERKALTASVSHDLRTPITVIKGYLDYLEKVRARGKLSEETFTMTMQNMKQSVERLERYVDCVRHIQKMEEIEIEKNTILISEFAACLESDFTLVAEQHQKTFKLINQSEMKVIYTDKNMLFKILENLLNNAIRFSATKIILTIKDDSEYLVFTVQDDGDGFCPEDLEYATSMFYSADANKENFGVGLFICKILCEKLDGTMMLKNHEDGGAIVSIQIKNK